MTSPQVTKPTTRVFAHLGIIGVQTDITSGTFLNDPTADGQMGCVVPLENVVMTSEAKELLRSAKREGGSFAAIMIDTKTFSYMGFSHAMFNANEKLISRDCDLSGLDSITEDLEPVPEGFITAVERAMLQDNGDE
jgi:hypothetical protein